MLTDEGNIKKAESLNEYLLNKNEREIIEIIMQASREERKLIRDAYDQKYSPTLLEQINLTFKEKINENFRNLVHKCFLTKNEYDAEELERAFKSFSIDEDTIYEIIIGRPHNSMKEIQKIYEKNCGESLLKSIQKNLDQDLQDILSILLNSDRTKIQIPNHRECEIKADMLINTPKENWLINSDIILNVFVKSSSEELVLICRYYKKKTKKHIQEVIDSLSLSAKKFLTTLVFVVSGAAEHYSFRLNQSLKGVGTNNALLDRILLNRYDIDMPLLKRFYYDTYQVSAREDIEDDTQGSYRNLLIRLLNYIDIDDY